MGFLHSSVGKESACNTGDPGSIPGLGRSSGEGKGYLLQCSHLENPMDRGAWQATVHGIARVRHDLATKPPAAQSSTGSLLGTVSGARAHRPGWRPHAMRPRATR